CDWRDGLTSQASFATTGFHPPRPQESPLSHEDLRQQYYAHDRTHQVESAEDQQEDAHVRMLELGGDAAEKEHRCQHHCRQQVGVGDVVGPVGISQELVSLRSRVLGLLLQARIELGQAGSCRWRAPLFSPTLPVLDRALQLRPEPAAVHLRQLWAAILYGLQVAEKN